MLNEVEILKDSSEPQWNFDALSFEDGIAELDSSECLEKLEDAKNDVMKLRADEEKKSQVQREFLDKIAEVTELNKDIVDRFSHIREGESEPEKIKEQVMAVKVNFYIFTETVCLRKHVFVSIV